VKNAIAAYFEDPMGTSTEPRSGEWEGRDGAAIIGPAESGNGSKRGIAKAEVKAPPDAKNKGVANRPVRLYLSMLGNQTRVGTVVLFDKNSADLSNDGVAQLDAFIPQVLGKPNMVEIRGHASRAPAEEHGDFDDPWKLCYARCTATMDYLISQGVKPQRIRISQAGTFEPNVRDDEDDESADVNSRVEIFAISEYPQSVQ